MHQKRGVPYLTNSDDRACQAYKHEEGSGGGVLGVDETALVSRKVMSTVNINGSFNSRVTISVIVNLVDSNNIALVSSDHLRRPLT